MSNLNLISLNPIFLIFQSVKYTWAGGRIGHVGHMGTLGTHLADSQISYCNRNSFYCLPLFAEKFFQFRDSCVVVHQAIFP